MKVNSNIQIFKYFHLFFQVPKIILIDPNNQQIRYLKRLYELLETKFSILSFVFN
jgi:hypothetical protein